MGNGLKSKTNSFNNKTLIFSGNCVTKGQKFVVAIMQPQTHVHMWYTGDAQMHNAQMHNAATNTCGTPKCGSNNKTLICNGKWLTKGQEFVVTKTRNGIHINLKYENWIHENKNS